jgi:regulatory protein RepA
MSDLTVAREALQQINPSVLEYDEWLAVGMALKDAGVSFAEWDQWSRKDKRYREKEMQSKWDSFRRSGTSAVGIGTIVKLCRDQGGDVETHEEDSGRELAWDDFIGPREVTKVIRQEWLQDADLPAEPNGNWDGRKDLVNYLKTVFDSEDLVCYVTESFEVEGKNMPRKGVWDRTAGELIEAINKNSELGSAIGDWNESAGAWILFNPVDGQGRSDSNITSHRFALVESDDISVERQYAIYKELELPIAALVHSGGKSLHAIVRVEAPDFKEYQKRVDFLYDVCKKNGLSIDRKNRNPSRLSRLPGATRNGKKQWLVATNIGRTSWADWADWISAQNDDLPEVETAVDYLKNLPELSECLIEGILRKGHKMLLSGPSKAGKSFLMLELAIAIAEGRQWLGWQCTKGRVLYVNLELDRASCYHRMAAVYQATGIEMKHAEDIDVWNLRGKAMPMTELAPRLIRRALKRRYAAVIIDPIYKVITGDENAADQMAKFCNQFDRVCAELGAAVIYCHHHSKGDQGQKRASDRASGSGVFARDPDALIDMIELEVTDAMQAVYVGRQECEAITEALDKQSPGWEKDCPDDDAIVADKLVKWAESAGHGDIIRDVRPAVRAAAEGATGWRIEGILREFRPFKARQIWFAYPRHTIDENSILADAKAAGELPQRRTKDEAVDDRKTENRERYEASFESLQSLSPNEPITVKEFAEYLDKTERGVQDWIKRNQNETSLRYKKGIVFIKKEDSEDN